MDSGDNIENFIDAQSIGGEAKDEGDFTISSDAAVKIGKFQLPFPGAWALKIVQAAVANGCEKIEVVGTRAETRFRLYGGDAWSLDTIESSFSTADGDLERRERHFLSALWSIAFGESLHFFIAADKERLSWDQGLKRESSTKEIDGLRLVVSHLGIGQKRRSLFSITRHNAEVSQALARYAYACPIPLTVDKRRIDVLQFCPDHGWSKKSFPVAIGHGQVDLPPLTYPKGGLTAQVMSSKKTIELRDPGKVSFLWMLTAHLYHQYGLQWKAKENTSTCYFIGDGVEIGREPLLSGSSQGISLNAFVSASGMETDASNFQLLRDEVYQQRIDRVGRTLLGLTDKYQPDFEQFVDTRTASKARWSGLCFLVFFVVPGVNVLALGSFLAAGSSENSVVKAIEEGWRRLAFRWKSDYEEAEGEVAIMGHSPLAKLSTI